MRVQIAVKMHRIAEAVSAMHIALHKPLVSVPSRALTSRDSHRGLQRPKGPNLEKIQDLEIFKRD